MPEVDQLIVYKFLQTYQLSTNKHLPTRLFFLLVLEGTLGQPKVCPVASCGNSAIMCPLHLLQL